RYRYWRGWGDRCAWTAPPPPCWVSRWRGVPHPLLGPQVPPPSAEKDERRPPAPGSGTTPADEINCETTVRPVLGSVKRIGSKLVTEVGALLSAHEATAGEEQSLKLTLSGCVIASMKEVAVFPLAPLGGSPAAV